MSATPYRPAADSLAAQCLWFFRNNPDEALAVDDITDKFGSVRGNVHTLLKAAVDNCLLVRHESPEYGYLYCAGADLSRWAPGGAAPAAPVAPTTPQPKAVRARQMSASNFIDLDKLKVDDHVPYVSHAAKGDSKWAPVFTKLKKAGQSTEIPGHMKAAAAAAAAKHNKLNRGTYKVAMTTTTTARVWRIA